MTYFTWAGFQYRTNADASVIEGKDGAKWNRTFSLGVRAEALRVLDELRADRDAILAFPEEQRGAAEPQGPRGRYAMNRARQFQTLIALCLLAWSPILIAIWSLT